MPELRRAGTFRPLLLGAALLLPTMGVAAGGTDGCPAAGGGQIGSLRLEGLGVTRPEVVLRELAHREGVPFSCDTWAGERARLEDLDIFADIRLRTERVSGEDSSAGRRIGLVYVFRELPAYIPFVAVSKTQQDGLSAGPALASLNFLGRDIRAEFIARFGGTTEFQASLSSPWLGPLPVEYDLAAIHIDSYNSFEDFHEDSWRFKLDLAHRIGKAARLLYLGEILALRAGDVPPGRAVTLSGGADIVPRLGLGWLWDGRDRRIHPRRGLYQEFRATRSGGWLGGPSDYMEWLADTRIYLPWSERNVLHLGALYQYRTGIPGETFPVYDRFHAGGVNTLRGFGSDALQGRSEWIATVENRVDLIRKRVVNLWGLNGHYALQGVAGVEAASLWNHDALLEGGFHAGAFLGLHVLFAGVERIRLELGSKTARMDLRIDVGIMEKADVQRFRAR